MRGFDLALIALTGPIRGERISLARGCTTIGRGEDQTIRLPDDTVSRAHATISRSLFGWRITDCGSTNGTYVNGQRIEKCRIQVNDRIRIGGSEFLVTRSKNEPLGTLKDSREEDFEDLDRQLRLQSFELVRPLGKGGFSTVYEGRSIPGGERIAVKVPSERILGEPRFIQRFEAEARWCMKLRHPNIVRSFASGRFQNGVPFLIMEYLEGESLRELIDRRTLTMDLTLKIANSVIRGLQYAHNKGVIHRDVKPEHIKADGRGNFKLMDFGIARALGEAGYTLTGMILGTPYYMAPEQALGQPVDGRADIYSLGAVLYEMATYRVPFYGDPIEVIKKHIRLEPTPPSYFNPQIPPHVEYAIMRALRKDPAQRFQTVEQLAEQLNAGARGHISIPAGATRKIFSARTGQAALKIVQGVYGVGTVVPLPDRASITVGRGPENSVVIPWDTTLSKRHARIVACHDGWLIEDLGSSNGTWVNQVRVATRRLIPGDTITLGRTTFLFEVLRPPK